VASFAASVRRACELAQIPRSTYRHERDVGRDQTLRERLVVLAQEKPRYGYRRLHVLLEREGESVNHKRLFRVYRAAGLSVKRRKRKRLLRQGRPQEVLTRANQQWVVDFVHDRLNDGRSFRIFSVVDGYTRECLALEADTSFASQRVSRVLDDVIAERTKPETIRMDNGPELTSRHFLAWSIEQRIELAHIQPGKPTQNAKAESFQGRLRDEFLNVSWFWNLWDAREKLGAWREEYNRERPHSSLGYRTPQAFAAWSRSNHEGFCVADAGQEASIASPLPRTPIPATEGMA
jgi:putative transposase